jgi:cysteine desulfurase
MEIYLDNAATTMVCPEAAEAALKMMTEQYGNPSSTHAKGREAKKSLDTARRQVSDALGCKPSELVFTSCGTEADDWAILRGAESMRRKGSHIISSAVEHDAIRRSLDAL